MTFKMKVEKQVFVLSNIQKKGRSQRDGFAAQFRIFRIDETNVK